MSSSTQSSESPSPTHEDMFVILVTEFDSPQLMTFSNPEESATAVREFKQYNKRFYAYVFEGRQWKMTSGSHSYLLSPNSDSRIPLFDASDEAINDSGLIS